MTVFNGVVAAIEPYNLALHEHLMSLGYEWHRYPAGFCNDLQGGMTFLASYDEYAGPDELVYVNEQGIVEREPRLDEIQALRLLLDITSRQDKQPTFH